MTSHNRVQDRIQSALLLGRKLAQLSLGDMALLLRAFPYVCRAACTVHLLPYRRLQNKLQAIDEMRPRPRSRPVPVEQLARAVNGASRLVPGATCLTRAIAACKLMTSEGYAVRIRFGVSRAAPAPFGAHCWVELEGVPVLGGAEGIERLRP